MIVALAWWQHISASATCQYDSARRAIAALSVASPRSQATFRATIRLAFGYCIAKATALPMTTARLIDRSALNARSSICPRSMPFNVPAAAGVRASANYPRYERWKGLD